MFRKKMDMAVVREKLSAVLEICDCHGDNDCALVIRDALAGSDEDVLQFIVSNELWGGSGSVADMAFCCHPKEVRRMGQAKLADLGEYQIKTRTVNVRTKFWTKTFREWQRSGI